MTAQTIFDNALNLLGYENFQGTVSTADISRRLVSIINSVYVEMCRALDKEFKPITNSNDEIDLTDEQIINVMVYGVAMWIAQQEMDGNNQSVMASFYSQKLGTLTRFDNIQNVIPTPW